MVVQHRQTNKYDTGEEDPERKKNLDPSNPYRQQWVEYYAQQDKKKADAAAASNTDSSSAGNTTATNDSTNVNGKNGETMEICQPPATRA